MPVAWVAIRLELAIVMGRRGHSGIGWLVLGTLLSPFGIVLAIDADNEERLQRGAGLCG